MNPNKYELTTYNLSNKVATKLVGLGFIEALPVILELVYDIYSAWAKCHGTSTSATESLQTITNGSPLYRRAHNIVIHKAHRAGLLYTEDQIDTITSEALAEASAVPEVSVLTAVSYLSQGTDDV